MDPILAALEAAAGDAGDAPAEGGDDAEGVADLNDTLDSAEAPEEPAEDEGEDEAPHKDAKSKEDPGKGEDDPFADLESKEGIEKARSAIEAERKVIRKRQMGFDRAATRLKHDQRALKADREAFDKETTGVRNMAKAFTADYQILRPESSATVRERFAAFGRMFGVGPEGARQLYEDISHAFLQDGKTGAAETPAERRLREKLEAIEAERAAERRRAEEEGGEAAKQEAAKHFKAHCDQAAETLDEASESYPTLAEQASRSPNWRAHIARKVTEERMAYFERTGSRLDIPGALARLEKRLAGVAAGSGAAASQPSKGAAGSTKNSANGRSVPQKTGKLPGRSISPLVASGTSPAKKVLTDEERRQENLRDPDFLKVFGGLLG